ncbi:MAG: sensor histidine kinase [Candidatus Puniceispirillaceae bacterium]
MSKPTAASQNSDFIHYTAETLQDTNRPMASLTKEQGSQLSHDDTSSAHLIARDKVNALLHDFNNFLMLISIASDQIEPKSATDAQLLSALTVIKQNVKNATGMLQGFQNVQRRSDANLNWDWAHFDVFMRDQLAEWQLLAGGKVHFQLTILPFDGEMQISDLALSAVLHNLIRNAIEAVQTHQDYQPDKSPDKSNNIAPYAPQPIIEITTSAQAGFLTLSISDNGPGIAESQRAYLFHESISTKQAHNNKQHGYGLLNAKDYVEGWGGCISYHDKLSATGACFVITIPLLG